MLKDQICFQVILRKMVYQDWFLDQWSVLPWPGSEPVAAFSGPCSGPSRRGLIHAKLFSSKRVNCLVFWTTMGLF